jgi:hypothetical protein
LAEAGVQTHATELAELAAAEPFAVISLVGTLERVPSPRATLERAHALLATDGLLFVSAANCDCAEWKSLDRANRNPHWSELDVCQRFGRARLEALLRQSGFAPGQVQASPHGDVGIEIIARKVAAP